MTTAVIGLGVVGRTMVLLGGPETVGHDISEEQMRLCESVGGRVHHNFADLVSSAERIFVCVGTPLGPRSPFSLDCSAQQLVTADLDLVLRRLSTLAPPTSAIAVRCTVPIDWPLPASLGDRLVMNPEFLREKHAMEDALHPEFIVLGSAPLQSPAAMVVRDWYRKFCQSPAYFCTPTEAILLKLACNAWHATKVTFANTIGAVARSVGANGAYVMSMLASDTVLNSGRAYLQPGPPFGGRCLPKDLSSLLASFREDERVQLLRAVHDANEHFGKLWPRGGI